MLEFVQLHKESVKQFNSVFVDPWFDNPIAEWWMNQTIDMALKAYYWPMYAATWEDKIKETINSFSICKI